MKNSKKSQKTPRRNGAQPSVPVVVPPSIQTDEISSVQTEVLKYSLAVLQALAGEMISPDKWRLALAAANQKADAMKIPAKARKFVLKAILNERYKNPINEMFDRTGFW